jgi:peptidoglycan hydrolase CwlO-like protein
MDDVESSIEKEALDDFAETTKAELKHLGDKIHEATDKGVHVAKDIAEEVRRFTRDATELTKLKMEIHHLKVERDNLYKLMGEQLRNLYKSRKLGNIRSRFKDDFQRLDELESELADREKLASGISLNI